MNTENAGAVENHRSREEGLIVYPVYSRRSGGLSIGVNLYPDKKCCNFNCGYCEVFPFAGGVSFSRAVMESGLRKAIAQAAARNVPVKDICFSGNGEPTMSPDFAPALLAAALVRDEAAAGAELVVISNGTGLLREDCYAFLEQATRPPVLARLWLKLDAGDPVWYEKLDRCDIGFERLTGAIKKFSRRNGCVIQTMHCSVNGELPPLEEICAWAGLTAEIAKPGNVRLVQVYGKARPSPHDPVCAALPASSLEERADALRIAFETAGVKGPPIAIYE
ncbi:MAG: radical SAM protein [Spirochaetaceae bacterium]|jgi:histidinol dehydrogenase|nr:radical SAM protein [Spirochaetaceae bacterium]